MRNGSADSGPVALTILQAAADEGDPYQLVILDMQMPEMDGLTLARSIKSNPALSDTKLLMLTSMGHLAEEKKWRDSGISAYLVKPVKELRLYETLVTTLRGVRSRLPKNPDTNIQSRPTLKILVAEDNVVNQKVALHQLQKLGYSADAVANGQEVLQALEQIHYEIVLMDCQMPELDGYETTRIIRSKESKAPTPIRPIYVIAMTANALTGDREQCMASGMNDYIAKPVRMDELEGALSRGLNQINAPEQNDPASLLDMSIIDGLKELREPGEPDPVLELVTLFCQDAPHRIADIEAAYQAKDLDALDKTAHSLKGSSSNLGAKRVTELAREIMEKARAGILPDAQLVHDLRPEFAKAKALLEKIAVS
jgi:CheY-like chemotaxis protein